MFFSYGTGRVKILIFDWSYRVLCLKKAQFMERVRKMLEKVGVYVCKVFLITRRMGREEM